MSRFSFANVVAINLWKLTLRCGSLNGRHTKLRASEIEVPPGQDSKSFMTRAHEDCCCVSVSPASSTNTVPVPSDSGSCTVPKKIVDKSL